MSTVCAPNPERLLSAYNELIRILNSAEQECDGYGYSYFGLELCDAVWNFKDEIERNTGVDEIQRRVDLPKILTSDGTRYADALQQARDAGLDQYLPWPGLQPLILSELIGVRRLLAQDEANFSVRQLSALRAWERELDAITNECRTTEGCQWLMNALKFRDLLLEGLAKNRRPTAEYNQDREPVVIHNSLNVLYKPAIWGMQAATISVADWAADVLAAEDDRGTDNYLGIQINEGRIAERDGKTARFGRQIKAWDLFCALHQAREDGCDRQQLMTKLWGEQSVNPNNLDQQKLKADAVLKNIKVKIDPDKRGVWRLVST